MLATRRRPATRRPSRPTAARRHARSRSPPTSSIDDVAHERHDDELLLEGVQDVTNDIDGVERSGHPRRRRRTRDRRPRPGGSRRTRCCTRRRRRHHHWPISADAIVEANERDEEAEADRRAVVSAGSSTTWFSTVPLPRTTTTVARWIRQAPTSWTLRTVAASVWDRRPPPRSWWRWRAGCLRSSIPQPDVGGGEERADPALIAAPSRPGAAREVDEEPVALVGRDAAGRRVRLDQVALLLEHRHLVAHRRRRHGDTGRAGDGCRADGLPSRCTHDSAEDRRLPFVQHLGNQGYRVLTPASGVPACQRGTGAPHQGDRGSDTGAEGGLADVPVVAGAQRQAVLRRSAVSNVGTWLQATAQVLLVRASAATGWRSASSPPASSSRCCSSGSGREPGRPVRPASADDHHPDRDGVQAIASACST